MPGGSSPYHWTLQATSNLIAVGEVVMCRWQGPSPPDDTSFPQAIPGAFRPGIIGPFLALVLPFSGQAAKN